LHCQAGLFYNADSQVCDWPWNNPGCIATTSNPDASSTGVVTTEGTTGGSNVTDGTSQGTFTTAASTTANSQCTTNCSSESNGFYSEGCCENTYCQCFHGEGILQTCPGGSVFNEDAGFCDDVENVACCNPTTDVPTTTFPPSETTVGSDDCEYDCAGQEDGPYPEGCCLPNYCVCTEGVGSIHNCNNGTVFDEIAGFCHNPNNVECCQHTTTMMIFK